MAQTAPKSVEIEQIQFKLHTNASIFQPNDQLKSNINLLATSSNYGIIFVGDPNKPQLKVVPLQGVINAKNLSGKLLCREVPLPNIPHNIAISCDGSLLAVNYVLQNTCFLSIYSVPSFMSTNIVAKFSNIPLVNENNVTVTQILWNPVISNTLAIILNNGSLLMYNLKETNYELFTLDKAEQAKCASWSPKGKQIVVGFPAGKLVQFKPDLKPARIISCPDNIHDRPFDTIAVQWLSTYQFAAAFLQHGDELTPCLYIINAPKVGNPAYINYYDICFSGTGPRNGQIFLIHIQAWNLLLVASANSMEMGILGTTETNETPSWLEYTMSDDSVRLALPMTADKEETYPIGISLDTGTIHQLMMNENQLPTMPMVHLLSTHGQLVSYDFLNLSPNTPGICSPPQLLVGQSELSYFKPFEPIQKVQQQIRTPQIPATQQQRQTDSSFLDNFGAATSTPATKGKQFFGDPGVTPTVASNTLSFANKPTAGNLFGALQQQPVNPPITQLTGLEPLPALNFFGNSTPQQSNLNATKPVQILFGGQNATNTTTASLFNLPSSTTVQTIPTKTVITEVTTKSENAEQNKPLYTIPPTFKPPIDNKSTVPHYKEEPGKNITFNDEITYNVIQEMIAIEVNSFQLELNELSKKSKSVDITVGNIDESKNCTKRLDDLNEINEQAQETFFDTDVQILRHSVNECFSMLAEAKSKLEIFENPDMFKLAKISGCDQSNRRKLAKLNSYVATNHVQLKMIQQQIDSNWSAYQDLVHQNSKLRMHIPSLEGIYQTLTKQKDILAKQRKKLAYIKTKLNIRDFIENKSLTTGNNITVDSLADSILSMSLSEHVKKENSRLSLEKIQAIRDSLKGRKIIIVKPHRPERMKSEVILECKLKTERKRDGAVTKPEKMMFQSRIESQFQQEPIILTKPAATKAIAAKPIFNETFKPEQLKFEQHNPQQKTALNFPSHGNVQFGITGTAPQIAIDKTKSQSGIALSNSESNNIFSSPIFANATNPNSSAGGTISFGAKQMSGNIFGSKPSTGALFPGNSTEKSAFTIPATFSGFSGAPAKNESTFSGFSATNAQNEVTFSGADGKNENANLSSMPAFNLGASPFSGKTTVPLEKQQQKQPENKSIFTPLTGSNSTFSGFNLGGPNTATTSNSTESKVTVTTSAGTTSTTKNTTDELLENLNICKPTATSAKVPENVNNDNIFSGPPTTTIKSVNLGTTQSSNNETIKPIFSGFSSPTTTTDSSKTILSEDITTEIKTTGDISKPLFSGFGISTTTNTQQTNKISFTGFGIAQSSSDAATGNVFSGFGAPNTDISKPLFSGFGGSASTASSEATKTPFSGFGSSTTSSELTKPQSTGFSSSASATATTTELSKTPFSGLGNTVTTSSIDTTKSSFSFTSLSNVTPITTAENLKINFGGLGTTTSSDNTSQAFGVQLNTTQTTKVLTATTASTLSAPIGNPTASFGALNLKLSTAPIFGTSTVALDATPPITSSTISDATTTTTTTTATTIQEIKPTSQPSIFSVSAPPATTGFAIFSSSGSPSIFGGASMGAESISTPASIGFGSLAVTTTSTPSIFAAANTSPFASSPVSSTTSIFGSTAPVMTGNIFGGATAPTSGGSIFGGIPKPDQSVFSTSATPFGPQSNSGGSIFGGANASNQPAVPFGQQTSPFQSSTTSIFGGQKTETTNIFGTSAQSSGGSIFGQQSSSPFGVTQETAQTSIFGTGATDPSSFGGGSIFGGTIQNINSPFGGAIQSSGFGAGPFSTVGSSSGTFSGFAASSTSGAFAQGGPSIAQTGFGSPNSSFTKPTGVFGGAPAFGSPPTFGSSPSFGGPPSFGGFGNTQTTGGSSPTAFSPPTQKNNLFEALGSSGDNVSSFGNLAQSANQNTAKPAFPGGSSFSSWR